MKAEVELNSRRVTAFSIAIARAMGLSTEEIRCIAKGACLHDIGKISILDQIMHKLGISSLDEVAITREHCDRGYQILKKVPSFQEAAEMVYAQEERWDGTGCPRGLRGTEIPLGARIFSIADALDAITSDRPGRPARSVKVARRWIQSQSGRQFDPEIVKVFVAMPEKLWQDLRSEIDSQRM